MSTRIAYHTQSASNGLCLLLLSRLWACHSARPLGGDQRRIKAKNE